MSSISAGTTVNTGLVYTSDTTGTLQIKTGAGAVTVIAVDAAQNVGIGTSSPITRLSYSGSFNAGTVGSFPSLTGLGSYGGGIGFFDTNVSGMYTQDSGGSLMFFTGQSSSDTSASKVKMKIDSSGNFQFNSGYGSVATAYGCRAWANFNGTGTTGTNQTIRASGNVSSVLKNGAGDYTVNFATAMPDVNYSGVITVEGVINTNYGFYGQTTSGNSASAYRLNTMTSAGAGSDRAQISVSIFR